MLSSDNKKNIQKNIDDYNSKIHDYVNQLNNHEKQILEIKPKIAELTARREENINFRYYVAAAPKNKLIVVKIFKQAFYN